MSVHLSIHPSYVRAFDSFYPGREVRSSAKTKPGKPLERSPEFSFNFEIALRHSFRTDKLYLIHRPFVLFLREKKKIGKSRNLMLTIKE